MTNAADFYIFSVLGLLVKVVQHAVLQYSGKTNQIKKLRRKVLMFGAIAYLV